jgi:hypothetical protein
MRNGNIRTVVAAAMIVVMLLFALFGVATAAGPTAQASRTITPKAVQPGQQVGITVVFQNLAGQPKAFSLEEDYPDGWGFTRGTDDASVFKAGPPPEWVWFVVDSGANKTVTYTLTVPVDADTGNYTIEGKVIDAQNVTNIVGGDATITVSEVPPPVYPTVTTQAATGITTSSATLNMQYTVGDFSSVQVCFAYRKSAEVTWSYTGWASKSASGTYAAPLSGLSSNTPFDFKAELKYDTTVIEGTTLQFTTATPSGTPRIGCFIATAAYGTPTAKQIDVLREFRDTLLLKSMVGAAFVDLYYRTSPPIADFIASNEGLRTLVRELLIDPVVWLVDATGGSWRN